jgi:hypothetical protein
MMHKTLSWRPVAPAPAPGGLRRGVSRTLRVVGHGLQRWARHLVAAEPRLAHEPVLEFYAEAGAPEGALYVDGRRIGVLPGVTRL